MPPGTQFWGVEMERLVRPGVKDLLSRLWVFWKFSGGLGWVKGKIKCGCRRCEGVGALVGVIWNEEVTGVDMEYEEG